MVDAQITGTGSGKRIWLLILCVIVVIGAGLRLIWGGDIEYKLDEAWTFHHARHWSEYSTPWLGMPSSQSFRNPGMSLWVFSAPTQILNLQSPVALARVVQISNILAIVLLLWFAWKWVPIGEREPWLWAVALVCFNPLAVLFQRKIWPPSILPLLLVLMLMAWWCREKRWGGFVWGFIGAILGQIHIAGFFFAAGFWLWTVLFSRQKARWGYWLAGSTLGALAMVPWLLYFLASPDVPGTEMSKFRRLFEMKFWTHWITEPFGIGLKYSLQGNFGDFLSYPIINGTRTYLVLILHGIVGILGLGSLSLAVVKWFRHRPQWWSWLSGNGSRSRLAIQGVILGYGILLTLPGMKFYRHYLLVAFPFLYVWAAHIMLTCWSDSRKEKRLRRAGLALLCAAQLLITISFLGYIHVNGGAKQGDYWMTYQAQQNQGHQWNIETKDKVAQSD